MSKITVEGGVLNVGGYVRIGADAAEFDGVEIVIGPGGCLDLTQASEGVTLRNNTIRVSREPAA